MFPKSQNALKMMIAIFVAVTFCGSSVPSLADEIIESINEALEYYEEKDYAEAVSSLDYAAQLIRQKRAEGLQGLLPAPLSGWKAEDVESEAVPQAMFGGMISAKRQYHKDSSMITVEISSDSPVLQGMAMMFSNPAYATAEGGKLKRIKKQKAIIKYRASNQEGDITLIVDRRFLISIKGRNVGEEDLVDYASAIDYKKLKKF
jgi:hypothetical protein